MFNVINGIKANQAVNVFDQTADAKLRELRRERGKLTVKIEETRLHDAAANATYKMHLRSVDQMIDSLIAAQTYVLNNRGQIIRNAM